MTIRKARQTDLDDILSLLGMVDLPGEGVSENLENFFVCMHDRTIIGCIGLRIRGKSGLMRSLAVSPEHRGKGIGNALIRKIFSYAKDNKISDLYLLTTTAEEYYARYGFARIQRDAVDPHMLDAPEFKSVCAQAAVCMKKGL
ncbi:MAG: arsenic resistance N-acetyltransferase ArsN2 [Candidatus Altiarchaeia archaeon]